MLSSPDFKTAAEESLKVVVDSEAGFLVTTNGRTQRWFQARFFHNFCSVSRRRAGLDSGSSHFGLMVSLESCVMLGD